MSVAIVSNTMEELVASYQLMVHKGLYQNIHAYTNPYTLLTEISEIECDVVMVDMEMKDMDALELTSRLLKCKPNLKMILLAQNDRGALEAFKLGVMDYLIKPLTMAQLERVEKRM